MNETQENDLNIQFALLSQKMEMMVDRLVKLETKLDSILDKYDTRFATKEELEEIRSDVRDNRDNHAKFVFWQLTVTAGMLASLVLSIFK